VYKQELGRLQIAEKRPVFILDVMACYIFSTHTCRCSAVPSFVQF